MLLEKRKVNLFETTRFEVSEELGCSSVAGPAFSVRAWVLPISPKKRLRTLKENLLLLER